MTTTLMIHLIQLGNRRTPVFDDVTSAPVISS